LLEKEEAVKVTRPFKIAELRVKDLDDMITPEIREIMANVAPMISK